MEGYYTGVCLDGDIAGAYSAGDVISWGDDGGVSALEACCACGGGDVVYNTPDIESDETGTAPGPGPIQPPTCLPLDENIVLFYHDGETTDDIPNSPTEVGAGFENANARFVGNAALAELAAPMNLTSARVCLERHNGPGDCELSCILLRDTDWASGAEVDDSLTTGILRSIFAISGQVVSDVTQIHTMYQQILSSEAPEAWTCGEQLGPIGRHLMHGFHYARDASWVTFGCGVGLYPSSLTDELHHMVENDPYGELMVENQCWIQAQQPS